MSNTDAIQIPVVHYPCGCGLDHHAASGSPYAPQPPLTEERIRQIIREELAALVTNAPQPEYLDVRLLHSDVEKMAAFTLPGLPETHWMHLAAACRAALKRVSPAAGADDGAGMSARGSAPK